MSSPLAHLLYLLLLFLPLSALSQTHHNISLKSSLSTQDKNPSWLSPSGEFAFGFHPLPESNLFLLAIWFDKIPEKTIVWWANKDNPPLRKGSKVELTSSGLILNDHQGQEVWRAESSNGEAIASAVMRDNGSFVLMSPDSNITWESFSDPTDTILPTQVLRLGSELRSVLTETDYSKGRFSLRLQTDGNLVLYPTVLPSKDSIYSAYWASNTVGNGTQLVFNSSGRIHLTLRNGGPLDLARANGASITEFYQRATLDFDGVFRKYVRPKSQSNNGSWPMSWTAVYSLPENMCTMDFGNVGPGACGFNSYCKMDGNQRPSCNCPPGYSFQDPNNKYKGCKLDFSPQTCNQDGSEEDTQFVMTQLLNTDWKGSEYEIYRDVEEDECRKYCLNDCLCMAAAFSDGGCYKKRFPLSNGRMDSSTRHKILIKVSINNSSLPPPGVVGRKKDRSTLILAGSVLLGGSVFLNLMFLLAVLLLSFILHRRKIPEVNKNSIMLGKNLRCFTYKELEEATSGFKEELGSGAFGTVYRGSLALGDSADSATSVAIKKLEKVVEDGEKEFTTEVIAIGQTHHKNLVQLIGFCDEGPHRLLVYEFMSNGSLSSFLFGSLKPKWYQRLQIAFGIARGLTYLHEECSTQIIHCDIKPQNILLDDYFTARISDFGLAKLLKTDQTRTSTGIRGTRGYVAPEWFKKMPITAKVDVYSFGIMLLEIICCRKNVGLKAGNEEVEILSDWAYDCYREGKLDLLVENDEDAVMDGLRKLERLVKVAIWCVQEEPGLRPSMKKVTQMLEGAVDVSAPPDPSSFLSSLC
ncbi:G-type lectin S-receptor-like serine/threonine-protein kinase LECRK3 [Magnolia sinica]|uniref:G-type lectin S-receptor-like serine/threonine-protein kinase LECRK3 n=1 Tax=Magnolia sinica TaxID=86752 RepID=UPI00265A42DA|nr:G-type lectin S-receptor-like serine/threonine-protein kinase LECRK3 [Magnolia sinica]